MLATRCSEGRGIIPGRFLRLEVACTLVYSSGSELVVAGLTFHYLTCFPLPRPPLSTLRSRLVFRTGSLDKEGTEIPHLTFASCVWLLSFQITHQPSRRRMCLAPEPSRLYSCTSWIYLFCGWVSSDSAVTSSACWTNAKARQENSTQDSFLWGP